MKYIIIGLTYDTYAESFIVETTFVTNSKLSTEEWTEAIKCDKVEIYTYQEATATKDIVLEYS